MYIYIYLYTYSISIGRGKKRATTLWNRAKQRSAKRVIFEDGLLTSQLQDLPKGRELFEEKDIFVDQIVNVCKIRAVNIVRYYRQSISNLFGLFGELWEQEETSSNEDLLPQRVTYDAT